VTVASARAAGRMPPVLLQVRVNDELLLDAGTVETLDGPELVIQPPKVTLFRQVLSFLRSKPDPPSRRSPGPYSRDLVVGLRMKDQADARKAQDEGGSANRVASWSLAATIASVCAASSAGCVPVYDYNDKRVAAPQKWEHDCIPADALARTNIEQRGGGGWELVGYGTLDGQPVWCFKRPSK
jgi:hypothetical protein